MITIIKYRKDMTTRQIKVFSIYLFIPFMCMLIQMFSYGFLLIVIGSSVSTLFMLIFILQDQMEKYVIKLEENAKAQASINVLQMRPHFIYNTMTSIYYLCEQDPKKAMETIDNFTNYLRKNFSAIAKDGTIPFKEELEHVRTYLAVEKVRFEGIKTDKGSEIIVTDNGPGFDENNNTVNKNTEPHIAINNIREQLSMMCNGTISFSIRDEGGTVVKIFIPDKEPA